MHIVPNIVKITTEETRFPVFTLNFVPFDAAYIALISQGKPNPRKTLTLLLPVTFAIAASACWSFCAADFEANVSGKLVPSAINVIPATAGFRVITQPSKLESCSTKSVKLPITNIEVIKVGHAPRYFLFKRQIK